MTSSGYGLSLYEAARRMGVPFQQEAEPRDREVHCNGLRFHYLEWGDPANQTLVLLHGNSQQSHSWDFVSLALCDSYHVIALDARGHGDSQWAPDGDYSTDAYLQDLEAVVNSLGLHQFVLVGHSMGGRTAYIYTSRFPRQVKGLVIVDSGPRAVSQGISRMDRFKQLPDQLDSYEEFAQRVVEYTGRPQEQVLGALKHSIRQLPTGKWTWKYDKLLRTPGATAAPWPHEKLWQCLEGITCPTLILRGSRSDVFDEDTMARMLRVIPGSTAATIAGAGHLVAGDNPADTVVAMKDWLQELA